MSDVVNPLLPPMWEFLPLLAILIYLGLVALGLWLLYAVVRVAVRRALRDHHLWVQSRGQGPA